MPYAITMVPVMPLRATPAHKSEMISQALWGECVTILETGTDSWVRVQCQYDGYEGWCSAGQLEEIDEALFQAPYTHYLPSWTNQVLLNGQPLYAPYGCLLKQGSAAAAWGRVQVQFGDAPQPCGNGSLNAENVRSAASFFLNTAYLWGGKSVYGADCSGFTQTVFKVLGVPLLRDAYQQATQGQVVDFLQEARPGDLAFFDNAEGRITHVGILLNDHEIIHASGPAGKARIDAIDNQGIIHSETGGRTHPLRIIRRVGS